MPKGKVLYDFTPETDEEIPLKVCVWDGQQCEEGLDDWFQQ